MSRIPPELHRFLIGAITPSEFRRWLYAAPEALEPWLGLDDYLAVLELDYGDANRVDELRADLGGRFVPIAPESSPGGSELIDAIRAAPDEVDNYLVLGDQLQLEGDPRGELIALQAARLRGESYFVSERERELLDVHRERLLGPATEVPGLTFEWFLGFVSRARYVHRDGAGHLAAIHSLFGHPSFAFLRELSIVRDTVEKTAETIAALAEVSSSPLSVLRIGEGEVRWWRPLGDLSKLWRAHPRLRVLELESYAFELGALELPELLVLAIRTEASPLVEPAALERTLPKLRRLVLHADVADDSWEGLAASRLLAQLVSFETSLGERLINVLERHAPRFAHLEELVLWATVPLQPGQAARIKTLLPRAVIR